MKRSGQADLPLHYGHVPAWLHQRMAKLGGAIMEAIAEDYGRAEILRRLSDPLWFQSFGAVLGMDWHSSGITTSVMGALKKAINPLSAELGIYICGGRGKHSRKTPAELLSIAEKTGQDAHPLIRASRLSAKIDNTAIQDGFQIYLHNFILSADGEWAVVQQGMNNQNGMARRYHWLSSSLKSFTEEPHTAVCGTNQGLMLNLTHHQAQPTQAGILKIATSNTAYMQNEARKIIMPRYHDVRREDVNLKRLGSILALAHEQQPSVFDDLLLIHGLGPRTLQSLTLVSEVIHGTPSRFSDPARYSFAHGGKDGHPFPVPLKVYDQSINVLRTAVDRAKIGYSDKKEALRKLHQVSQRQEKNFTPDPAQFERVIEKERSESYRYGGRTVFGKARPMAGKQLGLFD